MLSVVLFTQGCSIAVYDAFDEDMSEVGLITYGVAHTFIVPIFITILFDIVYILHKNRSVNFCCLSFDAGHRNLNFQSSLMRFLIWIVAFSLWSFSLIIYCMSLETNRQETLHHRFCIRSIREVLEGSETSEDLLYYGDLVPYFVLIAITFYYGLLLWRYGTSYSMKVNATVCNPWGACLVASLIFMVAQAVRDGAEVMSDFAMLVLNISVVWMIGETDSELERGAKVKSYLSHKHALRIQGETNKTSRQGNDDSPSKAAPQVALV